MKKLILLSLLSSICAVAKVIKTPDEYEKKEMKWKAIFLAGSAHYDWRESFIKSCCDEHFVFFDPISSKEYSTKFPLKRIRWEHRHISLADVFVVWIPKGMDKDAKTLSMTTLFECGRFVEQKNKPLFVGIEEGYVHRNELVNQLQQLRKDVIITDSLEALAKQVKNHLK